jgi:hypothetical protein
MPDEPKQQSAPEELKQPKPDPPPDARKEDNPPEQFGEKDVKIAHGPVIKEDQ